MWEFKFSCGKFHLKLEKRTNTQEEYIVLKKVTMGKAFPNSGSRFTLRPLTFLCSSSVLTDRVEGTQHLEQEGRLILGFI